MYYFMFEGIPLPDNPESKECEGAYILCFVNKKEQQEALSKAKAYINHEGWKIIRVEEMSVVTRDEYEGDPELKDTLECFDEALEYGVSAQFFIWEEEED